MTTDFSQERFERSRQLRELFKAKYAPKLGIVAIRDVTRPDDPLHVLDRDFSVDTIYQFREGGQQMAQDRFRSWSEDRTNLCKADVTIRKSLPSGMPTEWDKLAVGLFIYAVANPSATDFVWGCGWYPPLFLQRLHEGFIVLKEDWLHTLPNGTVFVAIPLRVLEANGCVWQKFGLAYPDNMQQLSFQDWLDTRKREWAG